MPRVFRVMMKDADGKPKIADDAGLGVRLGIDIRQDAQGNAIIENKGMSVFEHYQKVLDGLLCMHKLAAAGAQETAEIRQLRDAIDEPYSELSAEERATIEGLSTDLFDVENITSEPVLDHIPPADKAMVAAIQAQKSGRFDEALKLLRESKSKPVSRISYFRGRIWSEKGEPKVALLFFNHAAKLDPDNAFLGFPDA